MIEILLKLIDLLLNLNKYERERLHKTFQEILDPVFNDLMAVHQNYIRLFEDVQEQLALIPDLNSEDGKKRLLEVAESLRRQRLEFEPVREKLAAMSRELGGGLYGAGPKMESPAAQEFVGSVFKYFPQANFTDRASRSSALVVALRGAATIIPAQIEHNGRYLPELIESTIRDCREKWSAVCESYARLKIAVRASQ